MSEQRNKARATLAAALTVALASAAAAVAAPSAASARPTLTEALTYAESSLNRLCNNAALTDFGGDAPQDASRVCRITLTPGALTLDVTFRHVVDAGGREASADIRQDIRFTRRARFFCAETQSAARSALFMSCRAEQVTSDDRCSSVSFASRSGIDGMERSRAVSRSFAKIFETPTTECEPLERALNYVTERVRRTPPERAADFFGG